MEAFDIDAVWYGGPEGLENNPQTQISFLKVSRDEKSVLSVCRSVLSKWDSENRQNHFSVDCAVVLRSLFAESESHKDHDDAVAFVTCVEPTSDSTGRKLRTPTPSIEEQENDAVDANPTLRPKCSVMMWELLSKNGFSRVEAKSGRGRFS